MNKLIKIKSDTVASSEFDGLVSFEVIPKEKVIKISDLNSCTTVNYNKLKKRKSPSDHFEEPIARKKKCKKKVKKKLHGKVSYDKAKLQIIQTNKVEDMSAWKQCFVPDLILDALSELGFAEPTEIQIKQHLEVVCRKTDIKIGIVVGGMASQKQERLLQKGPEIVVGTPGRLWELMQSGNSHLSQIPKVKYLAIDETDRMLEAGHFLELQNILNIINSDEGAKKNRQTFVFSATLTLIHRLPKRHAYKRKPPMSSQLKVQNLIKMIGMKSKPKIVDITKKSGTAEMLTESRINCLQEEKDYYLHYILKNYPGRTLVFSNSITCVRRLQSLFTLLKCRPKCLHASMNQKHRLRSLEAFCQSKEAVLLATDVAARGLDIPNIDHVIQYQVPRTAEMYIHRSGRTARASKEGLSILLVDASEQNKYRQLCHTLNRSSDITPFPVNFSVLKEFKKVVDIARSIESTEFNMRKTSTNQSWCMKAAEDAGIGYDEEDEDTVLEKQYTSACKRKFIKSQKAILNDRLSKPLRNPASLHQPLPTVATINAFSSVDQLQKVPTTSKSFESHCPAALSAVKKERHNLEAYLKKVKLKPLLSRNVKKVNKKQKRKIIKSKKMKNFDKFNKEMEKHGVVD